MAFLKLKKSDLLDQILENQEIDAWFLLSLIAKRARRSDALISGLKSGQAFIGFTDMPSERRYRTSKAKLEEWGLVTFRGTNKGTIATLINTNIYDINPESKDEQETNERRTKDEQETSNKERKNEKKEKKENTNSPEPPMRSEPVVGAVNHLPLKDGDIFYVIKADVQEWQKSFPSLDVENQIQRMKVWLDANPTNRKTRKGIKRFIVNWLERGHNRAPRQESSQSQEYFAQFEGMI